MKHLVSAYIGDSDVTISVASLSDKSNEIKAIPEVLDPFNLEGTTITLDAIGCQIAIASQIT
jgi:predicted transposase YbfD/YdcC